MLKRVELLLLRARKVRVRNIEMATYADTSDKALRIRIGRKDAPNLNRPALAEQPVAYFASNHIKDCFRWKIKANKFGMIKEQRRRASIA